MNEVLVICVCVCVRAVTHSGSTMLQYVWNVREYSRGITVRN